MDLGMKFLFYADSSLGFQLFPDRVADDFAPVNFRSENKIIFRLCLDIFLVLNFMDSIF